MADRIIGLPVVFFCVDFASMIQLPLPDNALAVFTHFFEVLWWRLNTGESPDGAKIIFLCLLGCFPCAGNRSHLSIVLTREIRE